MVAHRLVGEIQSLCRLSDNKKRPRLQDRGLFVSTVAQTAIFAFLLAWNDYLIAVVFLRSDSNFTLPVGLESFFSQNAADWGLVMAVAVVMMLPPIILFSFLNRYFSVGGIGGSLAGR